MNQKVRLILSSILMAAILISGIRIYAKTSDDTGNTAKVDFSRSVLKEVNMKAARAEGGGAVSAVRNGESGWVCDPKGGETTQKIFVDLDNKFLNKVGDGTQVEITVEYFDEYNGFFSLMYDSEDGADKYTRLVYLKNTGTWKKHTFVIEDGYFGDRIKDYDGKSADFCITSVSERGSSSTVIVVKSIEVKKIPQKNPIKVKITTDEVGNIFSPQNDKKFNIEFKNRLKTEGNYNITYSAVTESGNMVWSKADKISIKPNEIINKTVTPEFDEYALYEFAVDITTDDGRVDSRYKTVFSYVLTADDGMVNMHYQLGAHFGHHASNEKYAETVMKLIEKSNSGGYRDLPANWQEYYTPSTGYTVPISTKKITELMKERGDEKNGNLSILGYGNQFVTGKTIWDIITTEEEYALWEEYVLYAAKYTGNKKFELWNEPNLDSYKDPSTYKDYVELAKRTVKVLHEYDPEIKLAIGCIAAPQEEARGKAFIEGLAREGIFELDIDAVSLHPYTRIPEDRIDMAEYYRDLFKKYNRDDLELWYTEYGYTLGIRGGVSDRENVNITTRQYLAMNSRGLGEEFSVYTIMEKLYSNLTDDEQGWGITYNFNEKYSDSGVANSAKHSYLAIAAMNWLLRDAEPIGAIGIGDEDIEIAHYKKSLKDDELIAVWSKGENKMLTLNLGCDEAIVYDIYGNSHTVKGNNGRFEISVTDQVTYIEGKFSGIEKCENIFEVSEIATVGIINDAIEFNISNISEGYDDIEVCLPSNIMLEKEVKIEDETAKISLVLPNEAFSEDADIYVLMKKDGKTQQVICLYISCDTNVAELSFGKELKNAENPKNWSGTVRVKNNANSTLINGKINFKSPVDFAEMSPIYTGPIGPGDTAEIKFDFPMLKNLGMYSIDASLTLNDGSIVEKSEKIDFTVASYAKDKPIIDGKINDGEWNDATAMISDSQSQVAMSDWRGKNDLSVKTVLEWDEEYLYLAVRALDDVWHFDKAAEPVNIWQSDSVQFGILYGDVDEVVLGTANRTFEELGIGMTGLGAVAYRWSSQTDHKAGRITNCEAAIGRAGMYTHYELKLPWSEVIADGKIPSKGEKLGFSLLVNDNDGGGRRGWIEYASGIGSYKDSKLFTYIELIR